LALTLVGLFALIGAAYVEGRLFSHAPWAVPVGIVALDFIPLFFFVRYLALEADLRKREGTENN
jgi:hypothetical protein